MWELVVALATGVIGLIAFWFKSWRELKLKYDAELRQDRLTVYHGLWAALEPLAKYARPRGTTLSRADVTMLATALKSWYFQTGGLYLSEDARGAYFALLDVLSAVAEGRWGKEDRDGQLDTGTFEVMRIRGSRLRSTMTRDVGTRRPFLLRWDGTPLQAHSVQGTYTAQLPESDERAELALRFSPWRKIVRTRSANTPRLTIDGRAVKVKDWDPWQQTVTVTRGKHDRVLAIDDERIVEGPREWAFDDELAPPAAVVWRRS